MVGGKNAEERQKGYAIWTSNKHEINKPPFQPRIDLSLRNNAPCHHSWSKEEVFFFLIRCVKRNMISFLDLQQQETDITMWHDRVNHSHFLYPLDELQTLKLVLL